MDRRQVQQTLDQGFAPLHFTPHLQAEVLSVAKGEKKVKKKLSFSVVLAMVLILTVLTAVAVISIQETGRRMAQLEQETGGYTTWPVKDKIKIVADLMAAGYIPETDERNALRENALSQQEALRVADEAIAALTGEDAQHAGFLSVMQAAWGPFEEWTAEQQAWYSEVSQEVGANTQGKTFYVQPTGPITKEEALTIARKALAKGYHVDESALDGYRVTQSFQIPEFAEPGDKQAYWYIMFDSWDTGMKAEDIPFQVHELFIHPKTGELLISVEDTLAQRAEHKALLKDPLRVAIKAFAEESGETKSFFSWSLESKAKWSRNIAPQIKAFLQANPDKADMMFNWDERASTVYTYGLPDDKALPQDKALTLAKDALQKEYKLSDKEMALLQAGAPSHMAGAAYDITNPDRPVWKFLLTMPSAYDADEQTAKQVKALYGTNETYNRIFKAELDARTGDILTTMALPHIEGLLDNIMEGYSKLF